MWIVPKNLPYCRYAPDTEASNLVLSECLENSPSSLMWRSKPSLLRTWLTRWKRGGWFRRLSGRILRPSLQKSFEARLVSSLEGIHASRFQPQGSARERMTRGISSLTLRQLLSDASQACASSRTSTDMYRWDSPQLSATWKKWVTKQRGEYSQRLKSERRTREKECLSLQGVNWPTPDLMPDAPNSGSNKKNCPKSFKEGINWPTAQATDGEKAPKFHKGGNLSLPHAAKTIGPPAPANRSTNGKNQESWPTINTEDSKGSGSAKTRNAGKQMMLHHKVRDGDASKGKLNPNWVEHLMGLETGWTALDYSETE